MNEAPRTQTAHRPSRPFGPHPGILAAIALGLTLGLLAVGLVAAGGLAAPSFSPTGEVASFYSGHLWAIRVSALLLLGSGVPLGIYAATVYARLLQLGIRVPGPGISFFGGIAASTMLLLSGLVTWLLSRPEVTVDTALTHALSLLAYATGGFGVVIGLGLLIAGIAVPALILRLFPRWFAWIGLVVAALSELSFLGIALDAVQVLLPVGRFGGLIWLVVAGFLLPRTRRAAHGRL